MAVSDKLYDYEDTEEDVYNSECDELEIGAKNMCKR